MIPSRVSVSPINNSTTPICPECGYDLRGIESGRCPECGSAFDPATLHHSRIAWAHRQRIGRVRGYWRTVMDGTFHPARLADACAGPVSWRDAQRFRLITILIASIGPIIFIVLALREGGTGGLFNFNMDSLRRSDLNGRAIDLQVPFYAGYLLWPTMLICIG